MNIPEQFQDFFLIKFFKKLDTSFHEIHEVFQGLVSTLIVFIFLTKRFDHEPFQKTKEVVFLFLYRVIFRQTAINKPENCIIEDLMSLL